MRRSKRSSVSLRIRAAMRSSMIFEATMMEGAPRRQGPLCCSAQRRGVRKQGHLLRLPVMRNIFLSLILCAASLQGATNINVGSNVAVSGVKRFGISGISHYYYDRLLLKNLVWFNAGFEGLRCPTMIRCDHGTATTCAADLPST